MSQIPVDNDDALATRIRGILHDATCAQDGPPGLIYAALDRSGRILVHEAAGVRELGKETPMTLDAVFGINSCTKISTTIAVLQLVERGLLELDEPIDRFCAPELADVKILSKDGTLIPTNGIDITMRMILTHTAGFGYSFDNEAKRKYLEEHVGVNEVSGLKKGVLQPVVAFEPGTAFLYGGSTDWAGEAVARLTGQTLGAYMKENIFDPLEAYDIAFALTDDQRSRLVPMHLRSAVTGKLTVAPHQNYILWPTLDPSYTNGEPEPYHAGSLGMLATSTSLLRVLAPLVRGGVGLNGARVLSERTIEALLQERLEEKGIRILVRAVLLACGPRTDWVSGRSAARRMCTSSSPDHAIPD
ncbi:beta-lactamase [Auriculariales sp. MPI-PUGE-AT-0066]|nr:beta-lactamase [Auriculariales sp. MPI-PUGE-AT-0066]